MLRKSRPIGVAGIGVFSALVLVLQAALCNLPVYAQEDTVVCGFQAIEDTLGGEFAGAASTTEP
jgi:UDP-N-acetylglucosamine:LPS N-acetylglucosamine transferase